MARIPDTYFEQLLWLAPMAGVTDRAFRTLCLRHGAGLTYSEMVSASGLFYAGEKTWQLTEPAPEEQTLAVQLFGHDPQLMAREAAEVAQRLGSRLAFIDVNMGCPVHKVVKKGEGSALMKTPQLAADIVRSMVAACPDVPITVKFRSGWLTGENTAVEFARRVEDAGAALVAVHGRSAEQMYAGKADWGIIAAVKAAVSIPVAGSGDVFSHEDALAMQRECGVDAVLVARGARGNPWIFEGADPTPIERIETMREHFELYAQFHTDGYFSPLRAQLPGYVHGLPGAAQFRRNLSEATTRDDFERLFSEALEHLR